MNDVKSRLELQSQVCKFVVVEGIKDFHDQTKILLDGANIPLEKIGPVLDKVNKAIMPPTLEINKLKLPSQEEEKEIMNKMSAKISELTSPKSQMNPSRRTPQSAAA